MPVIDPESEAFAYEAAGVSKEFLILQIDEVNRTFKAYLRLWKIDPGNEILKYVEKEDAEKGFLLFGNKRAGEFFDKYGEGDVPLHVVLRRYRRGLEAEIDKAPRLLLPYNSPLLLPP